MKRSLDVSQKQAYVKNDTTEKCNIFDMEQLNRMYVHNYRKQKKRNRVI